LSKGRIACVGAGVVGQGWAALFASKGYPVVLQDVNKKVLQQAVVDIRSILSTLSRTHFISKNTVVKAAKSILVTQSLRDAVKNADYVQESVYESYPLKRKIFREMDRHTRPDAILASSASGLLMSKIQTTTRRRQRCLIAHPFNPVYLIPLVELVPGRWTSQQTVDHAFTVMESLGKVPVVVRKEVPGYVANRLTAALWREAIDMLVHGVASAEDIDRACQYGPGIRWAVQGPFLTYHLAGGKGGIEHFLEHLTPSFELRWRSIAAWTRLPPQARGKILRSVKRIPVVKSSSVNVLSKDRDRKLADVLRVVLQ
jgi:carnitine 3-dehydrogenase